MSTSGPKSWAPLDEALSEAGANGCPVTVWWRDDDAVQATSQLERLLALSERCGCPLAVAAIPAALEGSLAAQIESRPDVHVLVHGLRHVNHAPSGEKKAEFGPHRPEQEMASDAERALRTAHSVVGHRLLPVFVPPWNRIASELLPHLAALGYRGLSTFADRRSREPAQTLRQVNTHFDPIDWRGSRSLSDPDHLVAQLARTVDARSRNITDEPVGILTHHLVHDEAIWNFCEHLFDRLSASPHVRFASAAELF